jgi:hypothetical protein
MLGALAKENDIGQKALIGVLSSNPYTIAATLRVFSAGIEDSLAEFVHHDRFAKLLSNLPVEYLRNAKLRPGSMSAFTGFWVDHSGMEGAVRTLEERRALGVWRVRGGGGVFVFGGG